MPLQYVSCLVMSLCNTMDCSQPDSAVHGILQARILEWVVISLSRESSQPRDWTQVSCIAGRFFTSEPPGELKIPLLLIRLADFFPLFFFVLEWYCCLADKFCDSMDYNPPGFSVHGIFQARILEWVAISFSIHFCKCKGTRNSEVY